MRGDLLADFSGKLTLNAMIDGKVWLIEFVSVFIGH